MNEQQLDTLLRSYNEDESRYLTQIAKGLPPSVWNITGDEIILFDRIGERSLDKITITKHNRFAAVPMHVHAWIEINYIYSGSCKQIINGEKVELFEGQLVLIDTEVPHAILPTGENDIVINILLSKDMLTTSFLSRLSNKGIIADFMINAISEGSSHNHYIIFHSQDNQKLPRLMKEMLCEYFQQDEYFDEIIESYMVIIFTELLRVFKYEAYQAHHPSKDSRLIEILRYIENNFKTCTLASAATHFNYSPSHFSTLIKKKTGKSFNELVRTQKLTHASLLLEKTVEPIYEIAGLIGYDNLTFFYKKFKETYGVSPQEYREKAKLHREKTE